MLSASSRRDNCGDENNFVDKNERKVNWKTDNLHKCLHHSPVIPNCLINNLAKRKYFNYESGREKEEIAQHLQPSSLIETLRQPPFHQSAACRSASLSIIQIRPPSFVFVSKHDVPLHGHYVLTRTKWWWYLIRTQLPLIGFQHQSVGNIINTQLSPFSLPIPSSCCSVGRSIPSSAAATSSS